MSLVYADSVEYVIVKVKALRAGEPYDPTGDDLYFAFLLENETEATAVWYPGMWETVKGQNYAKILRGSNPVLPVGQYAIIIKIVTDEEIIIRDVGRLTVED